MKLLIDFYKKHAYGIKHLPYVYRELEAVKLELDAVKLENKKLNRKLEVIENLEYKRFNVKPKSIPFICINTLPKSGSIYIINTISKGLNLETRYLFNSSHGTIALENLNTCLEINSCSQNHLPASEENIQILDSYLDKMVLHLRDPRQALLSWCYHIIKRCNNGSKDAAEIISSHTKSYQRHNVNPGWHLKQPLEIIDDMIECHYVPYLGFIKRWLEAIPRFKHTQILVTEYSQFLADEQGFFDKILDFYEIPRERFIHPNLGKKEELHFRKGSLDEWRTVFTLEQQKKVTDLLPQEWCERFGWEK